MGTPKGTEPWNKGAGKGWTDQRGYRWLYVQEGGRTIARREHRVLMERQIGRRLEPWEIVHHKDGNKSNNDLANLEVQEFGAHTAAHNLGTRKSWEARRSMEAFALMREELKRERAIKAELLEALQLAVSGLQFFFNLHGEQAVNAASLNECRAAIAKALGTEARS